MGGGYGLINPSHSASASFYNPEVLYCKATVAIVEKRPVTSAERPLRPLDLNTGGTMSSG